MRREAVSLRIEDLLRLAVAELPDRVSLRRHPAGDGRYYVEGLSDIVDAAGDRWIGSPHELIMRSLFDAIYERLHAAASKETAATPARLAPSDVRAVLDRRLGDERGLALAGWTQPEDRALVRRYFEANAEAA